jgi:hypothetical protein
MVNKSFLLVSFVIILSCSPQRELSRNQIVGEVVPSASWRYHCDSLPSYESLYMKGISADLIIGDKTYNSKLALYYVPGSLFFISAVNAGFEIVRIGITGDSAVFINRIDKLAYIYKSGENENPPPIEFRDLEYLVNKHVVCTFKDAEFKRDGEVVVDRSLRDVRKVINYSDNDLTLRRFEFFQKKTGEYIVGKQAIDHKLIIYSNYLVGDLQIEAYGGQFELNRKINADMSFNIKKYNTIYF